MRWIIAPCWLKINTVGTTVMPCWWANFRPKSPRKSTKIAPTRSLISRCNPSTMDFASGQCTHPSAKNCTSVNGLAQRRCSNSVSEVSAVCSISSATKRSPIQTAINANARTIKPICSGVIYSFPRVEKLNGK